MSTVTLQWRGEPERLDRALQSLGISRSRNAAQQAISGGSVQVDGRVVTKAGAKIGDGQQITVHDTHEYVSRGALKLIKAFDTWPIDVHGKVALDVGASTGGFTQVLLNRGAEVVLAVDVGHDQMVPELAANDRVRLWEGCNARYLTRTDLAEHTGETRPPDLIVGDLSFISLTHVLPALTEVMSEVADMVLLIKPQFEVGREGVGDGVVSDPELQLAAIRTVIASAEPLGLVVRGVTESPILGGQGNREFLIHMVHETRGGVQQLHEMIAGVVYGEGSARE